MNPYGEWLPVASTAGMTELVDAIGRFVRGGGHWVETGGYPFYFALRPSGTSILGRLSPGVRGLPPSRRLDGQPRDLPRPASQLGAMAGPEQTARPFLFPAGSPSVATRRADGLSIASRRTFRPAPSWRSPVVRLSAGRTARESLDDYARANQLGRPLREKLPPDVLDRFRRAVLVKYDGSARISSRACPCCRFRR